jgi:hypothetical protein
VLVTESLSLHASVKDTIRASINEQFQATLSEVEYKLYVLEPRGTTLRLALRQHHLRGENVGQRSSPTSPRPT